MKGYLQINFFAETSDLLSIQRIDFFTILNQNSFLYMSFFFPPQFRSKNQYTKDSHHLYACIFSGSYCPDQSKHLEVRLDNLTPEWFLCFQTIWMICFKHFSVHWDSFIFMVTFYALHAMIPRRAPCIMVVSLPHLSQHLQLLCMDFF